MALVLFARRPDSLLRPQFFAEDGAIFFLGTYEIGPMAIFRPYGGYLHVIPRILAQLATAADPAHLPLVYNLSALAAWLGVAALCFNPRLKLPHKGGLALALALIPHSGEIFLSLTNIQWVTAAALITWLLADDPLSKVGLVSTCCGIALCGLSGPFSLFLAPWFILRRVRFRTLAAGWMTGIALGTGLIQGVLIAVSPSLITKSAAGPQLIPLVEVFCYRLFGTFWFGYGRHEVPPVWWGLIGALAGLALVALLCSRETSYEIKMLAGCSVSLLLPVVFKFAYEPDVLSYPYSGDRYFFLPHVLLAWLLIAVMGAKRPWAPSVAGILLAAALCGNLTSLRVAPLPDLHWAEHVQPIREGAAFRITINPEMDIASSGKKGSRTP